MEQRISIPTILLSRKNGGTSPAIGPRRSLVSPCVPTGQWVRQCFESMSFQWLGTITSEEILNNRKLESLLIQTGDGNELLVLTNDAEIPASVAAVELILTAKVAVGTTADVYAGLEGAIKPSDQLWPFVALAMQEDPTSCVFVWIVRDASLPYHTGSTNFVNNQKKRKAFRILFQQDTGESPILTDIEALTDLPEDFWRV